MSHKRKGQLTVTGEWAKHLRPLLRRIFWKRERQVAAAHARAQLAFETPLEDDLPPWRGTDHARDDRA